MNKILALLLILTSSLFWYPAYSADTEEKSPSKEKISEWDVLKNRALSLAVCQSLESSVESPVNPDHELAYTAKVEINKQFIAPSLAVTLGVPYKERSLEHIPIPSIESLGCAETVAKWRAMYEYKTIPYKEVVRSSFEKFLDWAFDLFKVVFNYVFLVVIAIVVLTIAIYMFYNIIKLTKKNSEYKLHQFILISFLPTSPFAIAPLYFLWSLWSNVVSLFTYFIGCLIFVAVMTFVYLIRKYR